MDKKKALAIIYSSAKEYRKNLENRNLLFVYGSHNKIAFLESAFLSRHFLHLTGIKLKENVFASSVEFYQACIDKRLSSDAFSFAPGGTTELKLSILPQVMQIHLNAKMVGDYDSSKAFLFTKKLIGNIVFCLGFVKDTNFFVPNTTLKEDIRNITIKPQKRVLAVFKKAIDQPVYQELCYVAKRTKISELPFPDVLSNKIVL